MMTLRLFNTLSKEKETFVPIDAQHVRMYVCGPTVYDFAHIGNARPVIIFDLLFRLLRFFYGARHVTYVRNITDVDDKINARAATAHPGLPLNEAIRLVTEKTNIQFQADVSALGCLDPTEQPRATEHIDAMKAMIERLIARGVAYVAEGHVLFSPAAMDQLAGVPRYGALARRSLDEMIAGARVDVAPYKRDTTDFVLWKPSTDEEPGWLSPAGINGRGRPGWHIECSAMSMARLLEPFGGGLQCDDPAKNVFDIHGGGIDLVFPHHENEIAQSCCAFGTERMANIWMHNGFLQVEGEKMSKSLGNFVTIRQVMEALGGERFAGEIARLTMLKAQYRQPIDWTEKGLGESTAEIENLRRALRAAVPGEPSEAVVEALADDLNTPQALAEIWRLSGEARGASSPARRREAADSLAGSLKLLGFDRLVDDVTEENHALREELDRTIMDASRTASDADAFERLAAEAAASFEAKIKLREAESLGLESDEIETLIAARLSARRVRNFAEADRIRGELEAMGIALRDAKDPVTGEIVTSWEPR